MAHWKNYFILLLVQLFRKPKYTENFLVVSTTGLGDTLWATPAIRALREAHPKAYIGCLTSSLGAELLKANPYLSELFVFNHTPSLVKLYFQLRKRKIGTVLLFHTSQRAILPLCALLGASYLVGTKGLQKGLDSLLTTSLAWTSGHEIQRRLDIVKTAGAMPTTYELDFTTDQNVDVPKGIVIALHPGSKDQFKRWPLTHFAKVAQALQKEVQCHIVVTGSVDEKHLVEALCAAIDGAKPFIQPLQFMAALLAKCTLFITNDTGPLHLALAMKTPTIALFSPTNPSICGPYHNTAAHVLQAPPTCSPCLKKKCRDPFCMRQIGPDAVLQAALKKLGAHR